MGGFHRRDDTETEFDRGVEVYQAQSTVDIHDICQLMHQSNNLLINEATVSKHVALS